HPYLKESLPQAPNPLARREAVEDPWQISERRLAPFYAAVLMAFWLLRSGSYTSPLATTDAAVPPACATATTARFLAFFPPRAESICPPRRKSPRSQNIVRPLHQQRS